MLSDTHVHFDGMIAAGDTLDAIVARATQAGVSHMIAVGGSPVANQAAVATARAYPDIIRAAVGYNRDQAMDARRQTPRDAGQAPDLSRAARDARPEKTDMEEDGGGRTPLRDLPGRSASAEPGAASAVAQGAMADKPAGQAPDELETILRAPEVAAIGEIGLDFHHGRETAPAQILLFNRMLTLAQNHRLPVIVHTRAAEAETLAALRAHAAAWRGAPDRIGVMHCFTGGEVFARDLLALGFCISFSGILTFKNSGNLRAVAALVPDDRLLIETDSPYLAPEPFRGQPNEPAHVRRVAEVLAEIRNTSWEAIAEITAHNAAKIFFRQD